MEGLYFFTLTSIGSLIYFQFYPKIIKSNHNDTHGDNNDDNDVIDSNQSSTNGKSNSNHIDCEFLGPNESCISIRSTLYSNLFQNYDFQYVLIHFFYNPIKDFQLLDEALDNLCLQCQYQCPYIGLDIEWEPNRKGITNKTAILQISSLRYTIVIRIIDYEYSKLPKKLLDLLESNMIIKLGVDIQQDCLKLFHEFGVKTNLLIDLRDVSLLILGKGQKDGLKRLSQLILNIEISKSKSLRCCNWANIKGLTREQLEYAAWDAIIGAHLFKTLFDRQKNANTNTNQQLTIDDIIHKLVKPNTYMNMSIDNNNQLDLIESNQSNKFMMKSKKEHKVGLRKSKLYDNCRLLASNGITLSTCSQKKLDWYLSRGLGELVNDERFNESPAIRLNFEPKGKLASEEDYYLSDKLNQCVVCGKGSEYLRYSVVPPTYRQNFPIYMKKHLSHDIVLICRLCHAKSLELDYKFSLYLSKKYNIPLSGNGSRISRIHINKDAKKIRSISRALLQSNHALPIDIRYQHLTCIKSYFHLNSIDDVSEEVLIKGSNVSIYSITNDWKSHGELVVQKILNESYEQAEREFNQILLDYSIYSDNDNSNKEKENNKGDDDDNYHKELIQELKDKYVINNLGNFIKEWRTHFINSMNPQYLPKYWNINQRVDNREGNTNKK